MTEKYCPCVGDHVPNAKVLHRHHIIPKSWGGTDAEPAVYEQDDGTVNNLISLCPTAHENVHRLLNEYVRRLAEPPWEGVRQHYTTAERHLAKEAWDWWVNREGADPEQPAKPSWTTPVGVATIQSV